MKGCLLLIGGFFAIVLGLSVIGSLSGNHSGVSNSPVASGGVADNPGYRHKATSSISRASKLVGNFPTGQDTSDYGTGLAHIAHLHEKLGNFTIAQVLSEGRAVREQQDADRERQRQAAEQAAEAKKAAEEANLIHGDPDCLVLDRRTLDTEADEFTGYVKGTVKNTCDRDFSYVQVEINFYHPDGTLDNSGLANVNNLGAGDSWSFKTPSIGSGGGTWRVMKISGM